jgi:hypothetical protein
MEQDLPWEPWSVSSLLVLYNQLMKMAAMRTRRLKKKHIWSKIKSISNEGNIDNNNYAVASSTLKQGIIEGRI